MKDRWMNISQDADKKQEKRLENWLEGKSISFKSQEAEGNYRERTQMIKDAIQLKKTPKRVPVSSITGYFPYEYAGVTPYQTMYDQEAVINAWQKFSEDFEDGDISGGPLSMPGRVFDILDFQMYKWPGHGISKEREFQYVEREYMAADEYQDLIDDPTAWFLTAYFPRIFGSLKSLEMIPVLPSINEIVAVIPGVIPFSNPGIHKAFKSLMDAGAAALEWMQGFRELRSSVIAMGYPAMGGGFAKAPFDVLGDTLRGTRGIMMDMFRYPDEVKEACERLTPIMVKTGVAMVRASGSPFISMPLHKGADGFMSEEQFLTFYWPTLRKVLIGLIDEGLIPCPFAEGTYDSRLEIISDLPKGKTKWMFDRTDMTRAKKTIGQVACIQGNVPLDLMCTGTPNQVKAYCKELIEVAGKDGGYIFSAGGGLQGAKTENVKAFIKAGKEFGAYS
ncbi:uroporphyrinogen decarboxylase family protein [Thermodesulfobacteriota bacterium]